MSIAFAKYHGLGNDYLVIEPGAIQQPLTAELARFICDRHYGVGGDGILFGPSPTAEASFALRIFNPDGSEAEKSGNGLRIFSRYLWDRGQVGEAPFTVETPGGIVRCQVQPGGRVVQVEMGRASFDSGLISVSGPRREVIDEPMRVGEQTLRYCAVTLGNPHCVILNGIVSAEEAHRLGPLVENHPSFPKRINVQFLQVIDRENLRIEIWERGAGYTLASGSSSCAATAAAYRLGWCDPKVTMHMPGGSLLVEIAESGMITLTGPVVKVCEGELYPWQDEGLS
jgi:diaminopimelate epimerase